MADSLDHFISEVVEEFHGNDSPAHPTADSEERPGAVIGNYTLVRLLGEGGFGTVWQAEQARPVRRDVALKIIKLGMNTREVVARFEAERQALAVMDHPGIATVLDAGITTHGRPYFVMERVNGIPLTQYCNSQTLTIPQRLHLLIDVCRAVQHAHQKGVIHRDLKPTNILVATIDGRPVPKVIDFGIAKATGETSLTDFTLVTHVGRLMGTPAYMSPEQLLPGKDIDTRTDVYSLGVILFELLAGALPFGMGPDGKPAATQAQPRPSTRIRSLTADEKVRLATSHATEPPRLIGLIRGDLDWISVKALEQDRARRYDSAQALADDLTAFLEQRPIEARPPTRGYLLKRFTQRNKGLVAAASIILLTLLGGIVATTLMYLRADSALTQSREVTRILKETLAQAGYSKSLGRDVTMMREILDATATRLNDELQDQPEVAAELHGIIGSAYGDLNDYPPAVEHTGRALELQRQLHSGDHPALAEAIVNHASMLEFRSRVKEAEPLALEGLAMHQRLFGDADPRTANAHTLVAWVLTKLGRPLEGEASARLAFEVWKKNPSDPKLSEAPVTLAGILQSTNRVEESIVIYYEELAALKVIHGEEHPQIVQCLDNVGSNLARVKRYEEAEPLLLESIRQGETFFDGHNQHADHCYAALANIAAAREQWDLQMDYARKGLASAEAVYPAGHRYLNEAASVLTKVLLQNAERFLDPAEPQDRERASEILDELRTTPALSSNVKASSSWIDCLQGRTLGQEGRAQLQTGLEALQAKPTQTAEDTRRITKATEWLTSLGLDR